MKNVKNNSVKMLDVKAVFPFVGSISNTSFIKDETIKDEKGYLLVNTSFETASAGLFACGDVVKKEVRQIVTACSDGATAALSVANYLKEFK